MLACDLETIGLFMQEEKKKCSPIRSEKERCDVIRISCLAATELLCKGESMLMGGPAARDTQRKKHLSSYFGPVKVRWGLCKVSGLRLQNSKSTLLPTAASCWCGNGPRDLWGQTKCCDGSTSKNWRWNCGYPHKFYGSRRGASRWDREVNQDKDAPV